MYGCISVLDAWLRVLIIYLSVPGVIWCAETVCLLGLPFVIWFAISSLSSKLYRTQVNYLSLNKT